MKVLAACIMMTVAVQVRVLAADVCSYAGGSGNQRFYCTTELSDATILIGGKADDLDWVPPGVTKVQLSATAASDSAVPAYDPSDPYQGSYAFILRLSSDLSTIQTVYHFPQGIGGAVCDIKTTSVPGQTTGDLFISGLWTNAGNNTPTHCWVGKLDADIVGGDPSSLEWIWSWQFHNAWGFNLHNWDVGGDGKVVYYQYKNPSAGAWGAVYRLLADGSGLDAVANWWDHGGMCVSLKPGNHDMRSQTQADYDLVSSHSGKSKKKGKYPHDFYFAGPQGIDDNSGGYTGYRSDGNPATSVGIAVDRRDNTMYIGFNTPVDNNTHDFEPTVMRMEPDGAITWYSHLYDEWTDDNDNDIVDDGETHQCPPDQYVDGIAIDYSEPATAPEIIVLARCHGNAPQNFWGGTNSFHNGFTGTNGNEHLCYLARLVGTEGTFVNASWLAEYDPWSGGSFGTPYSDPILDGWPDHNSGWADLKTTRSHSVVCDVAGRIYVIANSRGPVTTSNAYQKAANPLDGEYGCWTDFVRVFAPDFSTLAYSSMLAGGCDAATGNGGGNVKLHDVFPVPSGLVTVGYHTVDDQGAPNEQPMPTSGVPTWGADQPSGESAVVSLFEFDKPEAAIGQPGPSGRALWNTAGLSVRYFDGTTVLASSDPSVHLRVVSLDGRTVLAGRASIAVNHGRAAPGAYVVRMQRGETSLGDKIVLIR